ncbi:MAG: dicarboxylate/amino acid:cation symporter [Bdellovibrionales bacterium]|nr:dicarboxylate/amino acid:cation symporter [Bdellovibrionales bacterium]
MESYKKRLYLWVLFATAVGVAIGCFAPEFAVKLKPLGDAFIAGLKMLIAPIIFCTVVLGISGAGDMKKVGRVGGKALVYFETLSTIALVIGLLVGRFVRPGAGFDVDPATLDPGATAEYVKRASELSITDFVLHLIPRTFAEAFTGGDLLQVLVVAVLFGYGLNRLGSRGKGIHDGIESLSAIFFSIVGTLMLAAPVGALGAMAFTIGKYGLGALAPMAKLMGAFYLTCVLFIGGVLGVVARLCGFRIWKFIVYIREELFLVLGTSSSESALPRLVEKLEKAGCSRSVVGLVVPAGYSFNLDGTNVYLTMAVLFLAQALNIDLSLGQELTILGVAMLTSKGASGVTGAGFITLAATLAVVPMVPVASIALILGIDRFMSEGRALTNLIGNGVAAIVISRWEGELSEETLRRELG